MSVQDRLPTNERVRRVSEVRHLVFDDVNMCETGHPLMHAACDYMMGITNVSPVTGKEHKPPYNT
jgi:hypothetical protein